MTENIKDPCISVCQYDDEEICLGCRRTKTEAKSWWRMTEEEKLNVLKNIETRSSSAANNYNHYV
ncbi:MAG: DUF1289 domain-containing protein [Bacteroidales bacterium]|nr:DUF1289 domain-containing protein [Bacteroidales bacterium]